MSLYRYHINDSTGARVESNLPSLRDADEVVQFLKLQNPEELYTVEQEQIYTVQGLGRDPDLH
jgi:hypothetical protein